MRREVVTVAAHITPAQREAICKLLWGRVTYEDRSLTDAEIARRVGVHRSTVARLRRTLAWVPYGNGRRVRPVEPEPTKEVAADEAVTKLVTDPEDAERVVSDDSGDQGIDYTSAPARSEEAVTSEETGQVTSEEAPAPAGALVTSDDTAEQAGNDPGLAEPALPVSTHVSSDLTSDDMAPMVGVMSSQDTSHPTSDYSPGSSVTRDESRHSLLSAGLLAALLEALECAPPEEVDRLRRKLLTRPPAALPEKRKVPRRTYAWYLAEELGEAVKAKARAEGVPPSTVAERLLAQAKAAGWF